MRQLFALLIILSGFISSCINNNTNSVKTAVNDSVAVPDSTFTQMFKRTCCGFTGGDGTYSVLLPDGRTVWIFGDTFLGSVNPDGTREKRDPIYIRNSFVIQDGDSLSTLYHTINGKDASWIIYPYKSTTKENFSEDSAWFWPGDGFIENSKLKVFLSSFVQADTGMWGFKWTGTWLAVFSLPEIVQDTVYQLPYSQGNQIHFGHAVYKGENYTYIYGAKNGKPHAARYAGHNVNNPWEFFDGKNWVSNPDSAAPMPIEVSEQFSVLKIKNKFVLISQVGFLSGEIVSYTADSPYGKWENRCLLYTTPLPKGNKNLFTYNALAHQQFTRDNQLLISYNTNSFVLADHFKDAGIYRPRFIRVPLKMIDKDF